MTRKELINKMVEYGGFFVNAKFLEENLNELYDFLSPEKYVLLIPKNDRVLYQVDGNEYENNYDAWENLNPNQIKKLYEAMNTYQEKRVNMIKGESFWEL